MDNCDDIIAKGYQTEPGCNEYEAVRNLEYYRKSYGELLTACENHIGEMVDMVDVDKLRNTGEF